MKENVKDKLKIITKREFINLPYLLLATLLMITVGVTYLFYQNSTNRDKLRFKNEADHIQTALQSRIDLYIALLKSGRGYIQSKEDISRVDFARFVESLELEKNYIGGLGIGYTKLFTSEDRGPFVTQMREREGFADFEVFPASESSLQQAIVFLEPLTNANRKAIGYDMSTEVNRRVAMEKARDTGDAAVSGKVTLLQETEKESQGGFLIYLPIYKNGIIPSSLILRQRNIQGFIYSPFRAGSFLKEVQKATNTGTIAVQIFDGEPKPINLMAQTADTSQKDFLPQIRSDLEDSKNLSFAGRQWLINYKTLPAFDSESSVGWTPIIFVCGLIFSFSIFGLTFWESISRSKLQTVAENLFESENQKRELLLKEQEARYTAELANTAKDEFISVVSHELRTPLNSIAGWTRILQTNHLSEEKRQMALEKIERNLRHQTSLIDDLINYSQMVAENSHLEAEPIVVSEVFDEVYKKIEKEAEEKNIEIYKENRLNGSVILCNRENIKTVFNNLLANAIKFTPSGGVIKTELFKRTDKNEMEMIIKDSGIGIDADFLPHIFDSFSQADSSITRQHGGLGLGLAISKHIVKLHNGTIEAKSDGIGAGAVFIMKIPFNGESGKIEDKEPKIENQ